MSTVRKQVAIEILKGECSEVESPEEAEVILRLLKHILSEEPTQLSISAPEINVMKSVAYIKMPDLKLELVNPKILSSSGNIVAFNEPCFSFSDVKLNCFRKEKVVIENGFGLREMEFEGSQAVVVQHTIDHLTGVVFYDRMIKMALVRPGGKIKNRDYCLCGSKKRFFDCCAKK